MKIGLALRVLVVVLVATVPDFARAAASASLKFGYPGSAESYVDTKGMTPWIHEVEKASDGTLKIKLFAGGTLVTERNVYERTLNDVAQVSFGIFGPYAAQFPRTQVADLPFLSDDTRVSSIALWRLYKKGLLAPEFDKVKVLALFNFPSAVLNTNKPVKTLADIKGLKLAVSTRTSANIAADLGAAPVTLSVPQLYLGMNRGVADGVIVSWTAVKTFKLAEVTKDHVDAPLGEAPAFVFMNKSVYAGLPPKAKAAVDEYSGEAFSARLGANNEAANRAERKKVAGEAGQSVSALSPAQYKVWQAHIQPVIAAWEKRTPGGAKILAAYRAEIAKIRGAK